MRNNNTSKGEGSARPEVHAGPEWVKRYTLIMRRFRVERAGLRKTASAGTRDN